MCKKMENFRFYFFLYIVFTLSLEVDMADPSGFSDWFNSNTDEFDEIPLSFSTPIPVWIKGTLIRNGGGMHAVGKRKTTHIFDSFAKLHKFNFYGNGSVSMSARFIHSEYYNKSMATDTIATYMQMDLLDPPFNQLEKLEAFTHQMDNTNVNIYRIYNKNLKRNEYMTITDAWKFYQIDENLHTMYSVSPEVDVSKVIFLPVESTAHPLKEYGAETFITFLTIISKIPTIKSQMTLFRMNSISQKEKLVSWDIDEVRYIHSFSMTKNYVVLVAPPITIDPLKIVETGYVLGAMEFHDTNPVYIYLINMHSLKVKTLKCAPFYFFHHINAYETNNTIVVDIANFDNSTTLTMYEFPTLFNPKMRNNVKFGLGMKRLTIDLATSFVNVHEFDSSPVVPYSTQIDFPIINERFRFLKYCYVYGIAQKIDKINFDKFAIVKKDVCGLNGDTSWTANNNYPSEVSFIPSPESSKEDDGILISHVFDGEKNETYLAIINATTMQTMSRSTLPSNVPFAFHGQFFPADD